MCSSQRQIIFGLGLGGSFSTKFAKSRHSLRRSGIARLFWQVEPGGTDPPVPNLGVLQRQWQSKWVCGYCNNPMHAPKGVTARAIRHPVETGHSVGCAQAESEVLVLRPSRQARSSCRVGTTSASIVRHLTLGRAEHRVRGSPWLRVGQGFSSRHVFSHREFDSTSVRNSTMVNDHWPPIACR